MEAGSIFISLGLSVSKFAQGMYAVQKDLQKFGKMATDIGSSLTKSITMPLVGLGIGALKVSGDFEGAMLRVQNRTGATGKDLAALSALAVQMGVDTVFSATESADAMVEMSKAGFSVKDIMSALPAVMHLAAAEGIGLSDAVGAVDQVLDTFGLGAENAARVADILTVASQGTGGGIKDLQSALSSAGTIAVTSGMSFQDEVGILRALQDVGVDASKSGADLKQALMHLLNPTKDSTKALKDLGISVLDSHGKMRPFREIIDQLGTSSATSADFVAIFGNKAGPDLEALVRRGGDALKDIDGKLKHAGGAAEDAANVGMAGFWGAIEKVKGALEAVGIAIGASGFLKWVTDAINKVATMATKLAQTKPELLEPFVELAAFLGVTGPLFLAIGFIAKAFGKGGLLMKAADALKLGFTVIFKAVALIFTPTGALVFGIIVAVALIIHYWDKLSKAAGDLHAYLVEKFAGISRYTTAMAYIYVTVVNHMAAETKSAGATAGTAFDHLGDAVGDGLTKAIEAVKDKIPGITSKLGELVPATDAVGEGMHTALTTKLARLSDGARTFFADFVTKVQTYGGNVVSSFASAVAPLPAKMADTLEATKRAWKTKFDELVEGVSHDGKQVYDDFTGPIENIVDAVRGFGEGAMMAWKDAVKSPQAVEAFNSWKSFWDDVATRTGSIVENLASDIATVILTGDGSIVDTFKKAGEELLHAVLETIITRVLEVLISKIQFLQQLLGFGSTGGGGMSKASGSSMMPGGGIGQGLVNLGKEGGTTATGSAIMILARLIQMAFNQGGDIAKQAGGVVSYLFGKSPHPGMPAVGGVLGSESGVWGAFGPSLMNWLLGHGFPGIPGFVNYPWNPGGFEPPGPGHIVVPGSGDFPGGPGGPGGIGSLLAGAAGVVVNVNVGGSIWAAHDVAAVVRKEFQDLFRRTGDLGFS